MCRSFSFPVVIERLSVMQTVPICYSLLYAFHKKLSTKPTIKQKTILILIFDFAAALFCYITYYHVFY